MTAKRNTLNLSSGTGSRAEAFRHGFWDGFGGVAIFYMHTGRRYSLLRLQDTDGYKSDQANLEKDFSRAVSIVDTQIRGEKIL